MIQTVMTSHIACDEKCLNHGTAAPDPQLTQAHQESKNTHILQGNSCLLYVFVIKIIFPSLNRIINILQCKTI